MGYLFLSGYIVLVGIATFLQKFAMKSLTPFQIEFITAIGMLVVTVPALLIAQKSLYVPMKGLPIAGLIGLFFSAGSLFFILSLSKLNAGVASAIAGAYVIVVVLLSWFFLKEPMSLMKIVGIAMTIIGVAILTYQQSI